MSSDAPRFGGPADETASPACSLHLVDPAYAGLDEETLARARWRALRGRRRAGSSATARAARATFAPAQVAQARRG